MKFPEKLWELVNGCVSGAIGWGGNGTTVLIDHLKFENEFLGFESDVFKTQNFVSFVRQLNLYGFRKCSRYNDVHEFKNQNFVRGRRDLLKLVKRRLTYKMGRTLFAMRSKPKAAKKVEKKNNKVKNDKIEEKPSTSASAESIKYAPQTVQDPLPYWWGNGFYPSNFMFPAKSPSSKDEFILPEVKQEHGYGVQVKDENPPIWENMPTYRNIIFVPVPAQYAMYPGLFNGSMHQSFPLLHREEPKSNGISQEGSF